MAVNICSPSSQSEGLTLVELIISGAVLVLILAAALPVWQLGLRLWQQESVALAVQQEERIVLEMVAREVRRARRDSVEIVIDSGCGRPALQFVVDEGLHIPAKIIYVQDGSTARLIRRKDKGDGEGTNVYLTNLNLGNGFSAAFVDPETGNRRSGTGAHLSAHEVVELVLRCRRNKHDYVIQTQVSPRN